MIHQDTYRIGKNTKTYRKPHRSHPTRPPEPKIESRRVTLECETLKVREPVRRSFVTDLAKFRHLFIRQPGGFVTRVTGSKSPKDIAYIVLKLVYSVCLGFGRFASMAAEPFALWHSAHIHRSVREPRGADHLESSKDGATHER